MSEIGSRSIREQSNPRLPVSPYFDRQTLELGLELPFENGPGYVGHELMVPNAGDYHTLAWMDHAKLPVRNAQDIEPPSNMCRFTRTIVNRQPGSADQT
jgi:choline monooxygenase